MTLLFNILIVVGLLLCLVGLAIAAKKVGLFSLILFSAVSVFGQSNCDKVVADTANMLYGKQDVVTQAAGPLINQGADVHVVTVDDSHGNLDLVESKIEKSCPSWRNAQGVRKSTLLALIVSKDRKLGVYYGSAWHSALDSHWNRIKTDYMVPRFRDGDYAGGFIAAEEQLTKRLAAAKDEALKPTVNQSTNNYQATDYSGLWRFFSWLLILGSLGGSIWLVVYIQRRRKNDAAKILSAKQSAQAARNLANVDLRNLDSDFQTREALGETITQYAKGLLDSASQQYSNLANSEAYNPDSNDFTASQYEVIGQQYEKVSKMVNTAKVAGLSARAVKENQDKEPSKPSEDSVQSQPTQQSISSEPSRHSHHSKHSAASVPIYTPPAPIYVPPVASTNVVVVNNNNNENSSYRRDDDWPVTRSESWSGSSNSSSSDSGGGGSSSWSSSDSSDSSSSSSWSSSDSGGSSDFGSSDSGGGGSDSF